jgi:hypothetical protein
MGCACVPVEQQDAIRASGVESLPVLQQEPLALPNPLSVFLSIEAFVSIARSAVLVAAGKLFGLSQHVFISLASVGQIVE